MLCLSMLLIPVTAAQNNDIAQQVDDTSAGLSALGGKAGTLLGKEDFPAGTSVCDWVAMSLALSGGAENFDGYLHYL